MGTTLFASIMTTRDAAPVEVFVCGGTGLVGSALVAQLRAATSTPAGAIVQLRGFCSSREVTRERDGVTTAIAGDSVSDDEILACCSSADARVCVVDCTSSAVVTAKYAPWLERGWNVATANKKGNSGDFSYYKRCVEATKSPSGGKWFVEATIGAGLPTVSTLRTLVATGDAVESVQGIFSGTMSFLFNTWDGESAFSETVAMAKAAGYTEPDPREDLNGLDVARKVVIAARECGLSISLDDVQVESLVPSELEGCSAEDFMTRFSENDAAIAARARAAEEEGCVLRFVGKVDVKRKTATVALSKFQKRHAFAALSGADNIFEIQSARYGPTGASTPLIIRGPGAGAQVTAAGIFGDLIALASTR